MPLSVFRLSVCFSACAFAIVSEDLFHCGVASKLLGEYNVIVKTLESCPDKIKFRLRFSARLSKYNRTTITYSSRMEFPYDFDDTWIGDLNVAVFGNGGWKDNFYNHRFYNFCSSVTKLLPEETANIAALNSKDELCPLKAGIYEAKDFVVKVGPFHGFPSLPYGVYKYEVKTQKAHENGTMERMFCFRSRIDIEPKKKKYM